MATLIKPGWSKPSSILFATELPPNERVFTFALTQALESGADLIILHAYGGSALPSGQEKDANRSSYVESRRVQQEFESLMARARRLEVKCRVVARPGNPEEAILTLLHERKIDRVIVGARKPGPVGKLLVGSVAETVLRRAQVPVSVVGPYAREGAAHVRENRTILCSASSHGSTGVVAAFAAELAARTRARLLLQRVIPPQEIGRELGSKTLEEATRKLENHIPARLREQIQLQCRVHVGDATEDLLYQGRIHEADLIVLGAHEASHFAAVTPAGFLYQVLAYARCPVLTLSPVLLSTFAPQREAVQVASEDRYLAGVIG